MSENEKGLSAPSYNPMSEKYPEEEIKTPEAKENETGSGENIIVIELRVLADSLDGEKSGHFHKAADHIRAAIVQFKLGEKDHISDEKR